MRYNFHSKLIFGSILTTELSNTETFIRNILRQESAAILHLVDRIDDSINRLVHDLYQTQGRIILTGVGKMGCIARKAAATFSSTGSPAIFLHAGEAQHGDLGIVTANDIVIALSYSGQSEELLKLMPYMHRFGIPVVAITGHPDSQLARLSDHVVDISIESEANGGLAPSCSTTVALALCDALALALSNARGFTEDQFAIFHPGGTLGRKLLTTVKSLMHISDDVPVGPPSLQLRQAIVIISEKRVGALLIADEKLNLMGILTDGDIRRILQGQENPLDLSIGNLMTKTPRKISANALAAEAMRLMQQHEISVLPVTNLQNTIVGVLHIHDLIKAGLA